MLAAVRQSLRSVARTPLAVATAILCLGAGMAATTSVFTILRATVAGAIPGIVDSNTFSVLTTEANMGGYGWVGLTGHSYRTFETLRDDGPAVRVIGAALWRQHFGGAPDALGRTATIAGRRFRVVGVAPERFAGLQLQRFDKSPGDPVRALKHD